MGAKSSKNIHCHVHIYGDHRNQPLRCSCGYSPPPTTSPWPSSPSPSTNSAHSSRPPNPIINGDDFESLEQVSEALEKAGLESSNLIFVNFTDIMSKGTSPSKKKTEFALQCLMEIPPQYKATMRLQLLGQKRNTQGHLPFPLPRPPPITYISRNHFPNFRRTESDISSTSFYGSSSPSHSALLRSSSVSSPSSSFNRICSKCYINEKDLALGCGHQICSVCGEDLILCPICQTHITTRIRLR
ncbi:E3 ubiquitin-protein ligase RGLG5, partial [Cucurbita argyrosperma subsp. argyrosperma]